MAIKDFTIDLFHVSVNARSITAWGETDPPFTVDPIDPGFTLRRGLGGSASKLGRSNPGYTVNFYLDPGSEDSDAMQAAYNSGETILIAGQQVGTNEIFTGLEGVIVTVGQYARAGVTMTDDQYTIELNSWTQTKGGKE